MIRILLIVATLTLAHAVPAIAGDGIKLNATVDSKLVQPGAAFRFTITVRGKGAHSLPEPKLPRLKSLQIVGKSTSKQISMSGMSVTVTKSITYQLLAPSEGKHTIPAVTLEYNGKTYRTKPITITADPYAPPPRGPRTARRRPGFGGLFGNNMFPNHARRIGKDDLMVKMDVDKTSVVPNEQVTATFIFYRDVDLWENPNYTKPRFEGFWVEPAPFGNGKDEKVTREMMNGKQYVVTRIRYALFPLAEGKLVVDPATIMVSTGPWAQRRRLATNPVEITASPLPDEGQPADYSGLVMAGIKVSASAQPPKTRVNQSAAYRVVIKGYGYMKSVKAPPKPDIPGVDVYEPKITDSMDKTGGRIKSTRVIEYPLIPRRAGKITIAPMKITAYDPVLKKYVSVSADPVNMMALPASSVSADVPVRRASAPLKKDIHYIKPDVDYLAGWGDPVWRQWWFALLLLVPAPVLAGGWVYARRKKKLLEDTGYARRKEAAQGAMMGLDRAGTIEDSREFYAVLDLAIRGYLADRWDVSAPSVTRQVVQKVLDGDLRAGFMELMDAVEMARYAPGAGEGMKAHLEMARRLIDTMEETSG